MLDMKKSHSRRVSEFCTMLADAMEWHEEEDAWIAYTIGLLHDVGRFPQYKKYGTFLDSASIDHGDLAKEILDKEFCWNNLPDKTKCCILTSVKYHNKKDVPASISLMAYRWCSLIRDADKMDIFHMVQDRIDNGTIFEMLPRHKPADGLSPSLIEEISQTGKGSYSNAHSLQDYRLIQLTWGCDLNFQVSVATLLEEGIFDRIVKDLRPYGIDGLIDTLIQKIHAMR